MNTFTNHKQKNNEIKFDDMNQPGPNSVISKDMYKKSIERPNYGQQKRKMPKNGSVSVPEHRNKSVPRRGKQEDKNASKAKKRFSPVMGKDVVGKIENIDNNLGGRRSREEKVSSKKSKSPESRNKVMHRTPEAYQKSAKERLRTKVPVSHFESSTKKN